LARWLSLLHSALVNLVFVALAGPGHHHAVPVLDLLTLQVGEHNLFVDADFDRLRQGDSDGPHHWLESGLEGTHLVNFLVTVGRGGLRRTALRDGG